MDDIAGVVLGVLLPKNFLGLLLPKNFLFSRAITDGQYQITGRACEHTSPVDASSSLPKRLR